MKLFDFEKAKNTLSPEFEEAELTAAQDKLFAEGESLSLFPGSGTLTFSLDILKNPPEDEEKVSYIFAGKTFKDEDIEFLSELKGLILLNSTINPEIIAYANHLKIPILTNLKGLKYSPKKRTLIKGDNVANDGDTISIDGANGFIYLASIAVNTPSFRNIPDVPQLITWADEVRKENNFKVFASVDTVEDFDITTNGADGIGLYRTEQSFLPDKTAIIQKLLLEQNGEEKEAAITEAQETFSGDYAPIFEAVGPNPLFIRLFDAPIDLFLPDLKELEEEIHQTKLANEEEDAKPEEEDIAELKAKELLFERCQSYSQTNPLISCRGVRLFQIIPSLLEIQLKAFIENAFSAQEKLGEDGVFPPPVVLIPYVVAEKEIENVKALIEKLTIPIAKEHEQKVSVKFGLILEVPRVCLVADKFADLVDYFVFNLDILQQTSYGLSEEDTSKIIPRYCALKMFEKSPFSTLDIDGVGSLIELAIQKVRAKKSDAVFGALGQHCAEYDTNKFLQKIGVSFVSVPVDKLDYARLFSSQILLHKDE